MSLSCRLPLIAAALAVPFALNPGIGRAQTSDQQGVHITLNDLDLAKPAGVKTLYGRINTAAKRYCESLYSRTGSRISSGFDGCVVDAVNTTVRSLNLPSLSALHAESGIPQKKG